MKAAIIRSVVGPELDSPDSDNAVVIPWLQQYQTKNHIFATAYYMFDKSGQSEALNYLSMATARGEGISQAEITFFTQVIRFATILKNDRDLSEIRIDKLISIGMTQQSTLGQIARSLARTYNIHHNFDAAYAPAMNLITFNNSINNRSFDQVNVNLLVAPNPFTAEVSISNPSEVTYSYTIYDLMSHKVGSGILNPGKNYVDLSIFNSKGVYILEVSDNDNSIVKTQKLVKI